MAKKKTSKFGVADGLQYDLMSETQITSETPKTQETAPKNKGGRPIERTDTYRFSLYLDGDLKDYIKYISWKNKLTITQYINDLVRADMQSYIASGGDISEWTETKE